MPDSTFDVVTGAFGFSGQYIARRLLAAGRRVRTLTNSPQRPHAFGDRVEVRALAFQDPAALVEALRGARVLYNTYWVRFNQPQFCHATAVENTLALFRAAAEAGLSRVVHLSITNPAEHSPLEYFRGKARLERALRESGLSYAIVRPAVMFGREDILINNIAWSLRHFPVFPVFGDGRYRLQPIYVDDLAELAVAQGAAAENCIINAIGPETFSFRELVGQLAAILGKRRLFVRVPPRLGYFGGVLLGRLRGDVMMTWEELQGLMAELLYVDAPPAGQTRLTDWARANVQSLGRCYASELARRRNLTQSYDKL